MPVSEQKKSGKLFIGCGKSGVYKYFVDGVFTKQRLGITVQNV